ncbi:MAG: phosphoenolpyruvate--protein phosphotransferase [Lachnospiraceae bacterium]|nr:phosphoenolpyruvate--protein phosphotransferase [Lachnospiraceae bacterium]
MEQYCGKSIYGGIAIGTISYFEDVKRKAVRYEIQDAKQEIERFERARETAMKQLCDLQKKALAEVGEEAAMIFEVHAMMLEDDDYLEAVYERIHHNNVNAEYAVEMVGEMFAQMFSMMEDEYMRGRASDFLDVSHRLVTVLSDNTNAGKAIQQPAIVAASDLAPSQTVQMEKDKLLAFVTKYGSTNSHTAILARTMGIPALIGIDVKAEWNGKLAVIDGYHGILTIEPEEDYVKEMQEKQQDDIARAAVLQNLKGKADVTKDGTPVKLYANIGNVEDISQVLDNDAAGIGLFRSEFLYLAADHFPTEEEQFEAYKTVAEAMNGKKVIIRTLDIGADKQAGYFGLEKEENPALGYRAIRICLTQQDIFKTQLRAIYRASAYGNIAIMYPMIISVEEVEQIRAIVEEVKKELREENIAYGEVEQGIMIETPAAVMISDELAKKVDFFSIGTNDLTQYTLAIDRQNAKLDDFYNTHHPAVVKMIEMVVKNAHAAGIWAGICGELGSDTALTETFLRMGVDELSVAPTSLFTVRDKIRKTDLTK